MTAGRPYSSTWAMQEYVVPRSMPYTLLAAGPVPGVVTVVPPSDGNGANRCYELSAHSVPGSAVTLVAAAGS